MRFPLSMTTKLSKYIAGKRMRGVEKFPLVMMLEPLHACNLTCTGCGRIREYKDTISEQITVEQCLKAVDECGSPIVSVCGGEPMIYRPLGQLVTELLDRGKHIYLCTHGMFIKKRLKEFKPTSHFFFNVHLDGMEATHDLCVERKGVFRQAIEGIRAAKEAGFMVCTNTTIYKPLRGLLGCQRRRRHRCQRRAQPGGRLHPHRLVSHRGARPGQRNPGGPQRQGTAVLPQRGERSQPFQARRTGACRRTRPARRTVRGPSADRHGLVD